MLLLIPVLAFCFAFFGPARAEETPRQVALTATVGFESLTGTSLEGGVPGQAFGIRATLTNAAGAEPPAGLYLSGWLRPMSFRNLPCTDAARAYLATQRLPTGAVDLNGPVIGVLSADGAATVVDPD